MKKASDIAREFIAWLMFLVACYFIGTVFHLVASDFLRIVPSDNHGEWDLVVIPIICIVATALGYVAVHTLLSLRRSALAIIIAAAVSTSGSFAFITWQFAHSA